MKLTNRFSRHCVFTFFTIAVFSIICISCGKNHKSIEEIVISHPFEDGNWTFEEEVIDFPFTIEDTASYRIEFVLNYDKDINELKDLPITVTLSAPDGMSTFVGSNFIFDSTINKTITHVGNGSEYNMTLIAFPKKQLLTKGEYHISFYRKAPKYDNYGLNNLTLHVIPLD